MAGCCHGRLVNKTEWVFGTVPRYTYSSATKNLTFTGYYSAAQLYEALFLFGLFAILSVMYLKNSKRLCMPVYLISYGIWRMIIEFFRTDYRGAALLGLYPSQWQSVVFILIGIGVVVYYLVKKLPFIEKRIETEEPKNKADSDPAENNEK